MRSGELRRITAGPEHGGYAIPTRRGHFNPKSRRGNSADRRLIPPEPLRQLYRGPGPRVKSIFFFCFLPFFSFFVFLFFFFFFIPSAVSASPKKNVGRECSPRRHQGVTKPPNGPIRPNGAIVRLGAPPPSGWGKIFIKKKSRQENAKTNGHRQPGDVPRFLALFPFWLLSAEAGDFNFERLASRGQSRNIYKTKKTSRAEHPWTPGNPRRTPGAKSAGGAVRKQESPGIFSRTVSRPTRINYFLRNVFRCTGAANEYSVFSE